MASAWGDSWGSAFGNAWGVITEAIAAVTGGGGKVKKEKESEKPIVYPEKHPWIHFPEILEIQEIAGITTEIADAVIEAVAVVAEKREIPNKDLETAKAEKELRKFLKSQEQRWKQEYAQLILLEYERREQEIEDAQIAIMLFEM